MLRLLPSDRSSFEDFVESEAPRQATGSLERAHDYLTLLIAERRSRQPGDLRIGAAVHASHLDYEWHTYGIVIELDDESCMVRTPGRPEPEQIVIDQQHIRVLSDDEWAHVEPRLLRRNERITLDAESKVS
jgi:hypothetical protein